MERRATPQMAVEEYFRKRFAERDLNGALCCLTDDIEWFGTGAFEKVCGIQEAARSMSEDISQSPAGYAVEFTEIRAKTPSPDWGSVTGKLTLSEPRFGSSMECRFTATCVRCEDGFRISVLHTSVADGSQKDGEYYPIAFAKDMTDGVLAKFVREALPGGFLCTVFSDNPKMLKMNENFAAMLGYSSADELMEHTGGFFEKLLGPNGYAAKFDFVRDGLLEGKTLEATYYLKKKDGTEICVRDHFRLYGADDGEKRVYSYIIDISDLAEAEEKLRVSEEEYRLALHHTGHLVYRFKPEERTCYMPADLAELFNVPPVVENIPDSSIDRGIVAPESIGDYRGFYDAILRGDKNGAAIVRRRIDDGSLHWFKAEFTNIFNSAGCPVSAVISVKDITDARKAHILSELDKERLSAAVGSVYPFVLSGNLSQDKYVVLSGAADLPQGVPASGSMDKYICGGGHCVIHPQDEQLFLKTFGRAELLHSFCAKGEKSVRLEFRTKWQDGRWHWVEFIALAVDNPYNDDVIEVAMGRSIDAQKAAEAKLQAALNLTNVELAQERYYQRVLNDSMPIGCAINKTEGTSFSHVGGQLMQELGYTEEELNAFHTARLRGLIHPDDWHACFRNIVMAQYTKIPSYTQEFRMLKKTGESVWVMECATLVRDIDGSPAYLSVLIDITKQKALEEELRVTQEETRIAMAQMGKMICYYDIRRHTYTMPHEYAVNHEVSDTLANVPECLKDAILVDQRCRPALYGFYDALRRGDKTASVKIKILCSDGKWHWERSESVTVFDADGNPAKAIIAVEDISDRYEKEIAFARITNRIKAMKHGDILYYEADFAMGTARLIKGGLIENLPCDYELDRFLESGLGEYIAPEDRHIVVSFCAAERLKRNFAAGRTSDSLDFRRLDANGARLWTRVEAEMLVDPYTSGLRGYFLFVDIDADKTELLSMHKRAETDGLTGLYNRAAFQDVVAHAVCKDEGALHALVITDIDELKRINDLFGHDAGDRAIISMAEALSAIVPENGAAGRIGGDEFMAFVPNVGGHDLLGRRLKEFIEAVNKNPFGGDREKRLGCSVGALVFRSGNRDFAQLYKEADGALYAAKESGKNRFVIV